MRDYAEFVRDLNNSQSAVSTVAMYLQRKRQHVILPPHQVTPTPEERYEYTDEGDILVGRKVQVKGSSRDFCSVEDFGFPMITVDESYKIEEQKKDPPLCYFIVNKSLSGAIVIDWNTIDSWDEHKSVEPRQGNRECFYRRCPAELCKWRNLRSST